MGLVKTIKYWFLMRPVHKHICLRAAKGPPLKKRAAFSAASGREPALRSLPPCWGLLASKAFGEGATRAFAISGHLPGARQGGRRVSQRRIPPCPREVSLCALSRWDHDTQPREGARAVTQLAPTPRASAEGFTGEDENHLGVGCMRGVVLLLNHPHKAPPGSPEGTWGEAGSSSLMSPHSWSRQSSNSPLSTPGALEKGVARAAGLFPATLTPGKPGSCV